LSKQAATAIDHDTANKKAAEAAFLLVHSALI